MAVSARQIALQPPRFTALILAAGLTLSACTTVGPNFSRPEVPATKAYAMEGETTARGLRLDPDLRVAGPWWQAFGSETLNQTVRLALAESPGVAEAGATLERFQANEQAGRAALGPQADVSSDAQRQKFNSKAFGFSGAPNASGFSGFGNRTFNLYSLGGNVRYDLDVFGGGRRRAEQAAALTARAAYQADAAYLTLSGQVALQAIRIAGLRAQMQLLDQILDDDRRLMELAIKAEAIGGIPRTTRTLVEIQLANDQAAMPPLRRQYDAARHRLALLVGRSPATWTAPDFELAQFKVPADIPISLPSQLVRKRPDILVAEAQLHAAVAAVGVATADQYPDVRLSARGALSALTPGNVLSTDSTGFTLFSGITAPLFDGGARKAKTRAAEAEARAALARYRQTVLEAFSQVADAMAALQTDQQQLAALERAVAASRSEADDTLEAAKLGGATAQKVIETRRELVRNLRALADAEAQHLADLVQLFAASASDWREAKAAGGQGGVASGH